MFRRKVRWVEPQKFDDLFASEADIVDLDDEDSESAYESLDSQLIEHINQALAAIYPQDSAGKAERPYQPNLRTGGPITPDISMFVGVILFLNYCQRSMGFFQSHFITIEFSLSYTRTVKMENRISARSLYIGTT